MKKSIPIILSIILIINLFGVSVISIGIPFIDISIKDDLYDMVIISPNEFSNELQPLIDHKKSVGINTFLKTTDDIYIEYNGRDEAEQIKYFIIVFLH
jgi:hypothetical protein